MDWKLARAQASAGEIIRVLISPAITRECAALLVGQVYCLLSAASRHH